MKYQLSLEVDAYISQFPISTQLKLQQLRQIILKAAPKAQEIISYKMPANKVYGVLVYFAGYKHHIGFYPTGCGIKAFQKEISVYKNSKGAVQFLIDEKLPVNLIAKMVRYRMNEDKLKNLLKSKNTKVKKELN